MADKPTTKVSKATLYKMVSYKGMKSGEKYKGMSTTKELAFMKEDFGKGMSAVISGINSLGASVNGIALGVQSMTSSMRLSVAKQIKSADKLIKIQEKGIVDDKTREKTKIKDEQRRRQLEKRNEAENASEIGQPSLFKKIRKQFGENTKKSFGGLFSGLVRFSGFLFKATAGFAALTWLAKNPDSIQRLAKTLNSVGKFLLQMSSFLAGSAMDGLIKFLENPVSLKGLIGSLQFLASAAPLFVSLAFLKNPVGTVRAFAWVIGALGKSISGMFKAGKKMDMLRMFHRNKFAKLGLGAGLGLGVGIIGSMMSGEGLDPETLGATTGAGLGATGGAMLGNAIGGPVGGMLLGAAGGALGGKVGGSIGKMLKPLTEPIGRYFNMIGKAFNDIMAPIKDSLAGFFEALGGAMNGILDFIEPHMPMITKIIGIGVNTLFSPLFLGLKALTAVLKFFSPNKQKEETTKTTKPSISDSMSYTRKGNPETGLQEVVDGTQGKGIDIVAANQHNYESQIALIEKKKRNDKRITEARGGTFDPSQYDKKLLKLEKAYNATLEYGDGIQTSASREFTGKAKGGWINGPMSGYPVSLDGKTTSFIGHGTEWVGAKMSSGGAFVVPFNTPATKKDSGLTSRRFREAMAGGYALPKKADGGKVEPDQLVGGHTDITVKMGEDGVSSKSKEKVQYAIDVNHLYLHRKQIENQLPDGATIDDIINKKPINIDSRKLDRILASSDAAKATRERRMMRNLELIKGMTFAGGFETQKKAAKFLYNKAIGIKENVGSLINQAKLNMVDKKMKAAESKVIQAPPQTADPIVTGGGGGSSFDVPIVTNEERDADPYLITRFGLVSEFNGDMADLM